MDIIMEAMKEERRGPLTQQTPGKNIAPGLIQRMFEEWGKNIIKPVTTLLTEIFAVGVFAENG